MKNIKLLQYFLPLMLLGSINASGYEISFKENLLASSSTINERGGSICLEDESEEYPDEHVIDLVVKGKQSNTSTTYKSKRRCCHSTRRKCRTCYEEDCVCACDCRCRKCMKGCLKGCVGCPLVCLFGSTDVCEDVGEFLCNNDTDCQGPFRRCCASCYNGCTKVCKCAVGCAAVGAATYYSSLWPFGFTGVVWWQTAFQSLFTSVTSWCTCRKYSRCCCVDIWMSTRPSFCQDCKGFCDDDGDGYLLGDNRRQELDSCYVLCC